MAVVALVVVVLVVHVLMLVVQVDVDLNVAACVEPEAWEMIEVDDNKNLDSVDVSHYVELMVVENVAGVVLSD